jgi:hypothetical protein
MAYLVRNSGGARPPFPAVGARWMGAQVQAQASPAWASTMGGAGWWRGTGHKAAREAARCGVAALEKAAVSGCATRGAHAAPVMEKVRRCFFLEKP